MFEDFSGGDFYEFPSFEVALFSIFLAFVLSGAIGFVYHFTAQGATISRNFIQAMMLSSIVTCMVIMAVGNNIAAGFGIIGAIAIIRFRMRVENPRNIIFIFAALSVGIGAGVYGYAIAISGTLVFCLVAVLLHFSPYGYQRIRREFNLDFVLLKEFPSQTIDDFLKPRCQDYKMISVSSRNRGDRYEYFVMLGPNISRDTFFQEMKNHEALSGIRLVRSDNLLKL